MPYAKLEPSGCGTHKDRVKLRIDCFMNPDDPHYGKCYVEVPVFPPEGYLGKVDKEGTPKSQADYDAWVLSLPHIWQNNPFHSHFIYPDKDATDADIKAEIDRTLTYFYTFHQYAWDNNLKFIDEWKKVPKRVGDIRCPFVKGDPKDSLANQQRVAEILTRLPEFRIGKKIIPKTDLNIGDKGTIDAGMEPTGTRNSNWYDDYVSFLIDNPANATGSIDTVKTWATDNLTDFKVGFFFNVSGVTYQCRDSEAIGAVASGAERTFTGLTIDVTAGDYIGCWHATGNGLELSTIGFSNIEYIKDEAGAAIVKDAQADYAHTFTADDTMSLYGTGTEAGGNVTVTPTTKALTLTTYAPVIKLKVIPPTLALTLTTYAPNVIIGTVVTPTTLAISDTEYAPVIKLGVIPPTKALTLTTYAPTIKVDLEVIPTTLALTLTTYAPVIKLKVIPSTASLTLTAYVPVIKLKVIPTTKALTLTTYAPTVSTPRLVTPTTLALSLTEYAPTVSTPRLVTPSTLALVLTTYIPAVTVAPNTLVTPSTLALLLATYAPTVLVSAANLYFDVYLHPRALEIYLHKTDLDVELHNQDMDVSLNKQSLNVELHNQDMTVKVRNEQ